MTKITIHIPSELYEVLREVAHVQRISMAEIVRLALRDYLSNSLTTREV